VAVQVPTPDRLKEGLGGYENLQFTLVDCPGHASLIRTIIGGERWTGGRDPHHRQADCGPDRHCFTRAPISQPEVHVARPSATDIDTAQGMLRREHFDGRLLYEDRVTDCLGLCVGAWAASRTQARRLST